MPRLVFLFSLLVWAGVAVPAMAQEESPAELAPGGTFFDDDGSIHEGAIEGLVAADITRGCDDTGINFCPDRAVTRGEMAAFLDRALDLPTTSSAGFIDTSTSQFAESIDNLAGAGVTLGCNPPENDLYCPQEPVTREQMASFLVRALDLNPVDIDSRFTDTEVIGTEFTDTEVSVHRLDVEALAAAGITKGCNPPDNDEYCPTDPVTRAEMATFLVRALPELTANTPPERIFHRVSRFTTYHDCCEPRVHNIELIADAIDGVVVPPDDVFSVNDFTGPRTSSQGYVEAPILCNTPGTCMGIGGGISQFATTIFNAIFYGGYEEVAHRPHSEWISRYPVGIEATLAYGSLDVAFRNDTQTPVVIRTYHTATSITVELWGYAGGWQVSGYHPIGNRTSAIDVIEAGESWARRVSWAVVGSPPGYVLVTRTLTQHGESTSQSWGHSYQSIYGRTISIQ